jgi:hypothetical protein
MNPAESAAKLLTHDEARRIAANTNQIISRSFSVIAYGEFNMSQRRFPPPWSVEELDACFVVKDHAGQRLTYVYFPRKSRRAGIDFFCVTPVTLSMADHTVVIT